MQTTKSNRQLKQPLEVRVLKLTTLALTTFLVSFLSISVLTPVQNSAAEEILAALQTTNGTVAVATTGEPVNLSLTAGTGNSSTTGEASGSVCPKGWKLPGFSGNGSYRELVKAYGMPETALEGGDEYAAKLAATPLKFVYNGFYAANSLRAYGDDGSYWTRQGLADSMAGQFFHDPKGKFSAVQGYPKYGGMAVRCYYNAVTLQDFSAATCANLETAKTLTLKDARDENSYTLARLADGNCWLTQNLRLGSTTQDYTLTPENSNVSANYTLAAANVTTATDETWGYDEAHVYTYAGTGNATKYGNLYSWYAATAGTGTTSMTTGEASASVCPKGWALPPNSGNGSYVNLFEKEGVSDIGANLEKITGEPMGFVYGGFYQATNGAAQAPMGLARSGENGSYWVRNSISAHSAHHMFFNSADSGDPNQAASGTYTKSAGFAVRCVIAL